MSGIMDHLLHQAFSWVCGQAVAHTWICGGAPLPCCQRCTGLYLGAFASGLLCLLLRPVMRRRFLWIHGMFLLVMIPFGFHLVPQDALIRGWSGVLFGFGLVVFLLLPNVPEPQQATHGRPPLKLAGLYWCGLVGTLGVIIAIEGAPAKVNSHFISTGLLFGALMLYGLVLINVWRAFGWLCACCRRQRLMDVHE